MTKQRIRRRPDARTVRGSGKKNPIAIAAVRAYLSGRKDIPPSGVASHS